MILCMVKKNIKIFMGKWLFIIFIIYTIYILPILQYSHFSHLSYWEFILLAITDMYYILYVLVLSYICFVFKNTISEEKEILIRSKNYLKYFWAQTISLIAISALFIFLHLLIAMILGFRLSCGNIFTNSMNEDLAFYAKYFYTPFEGILSSIAYMILGLSIFSILIIFLCHYFKPKTVVIIVILFFLSAMLNYQIFLNESTIPYIFLDNYIILSHAIYSLGIHFYNLLLCEFSFAIGLMFIIKKFWFKQITSKLWTKKYQKNGC